MAGLSILWRQQMWFLFTGLWTEGQVEAGQPTNYTLSSKNPVLQNITDFLIEEASAEEEELLGKSEDNSEETEQVI